MYCNGNQLLGKDNLVCNISVNILVKKKASTSQADGGCWSAIVLTCYGFRVNGWHKVKVCKSYMQIGFQLRLSINFLFHKDYLIQANAVTKGFCFLFHIINHVGTIQRGVSVRYSILLLFLLMFQ